MVIEATNKQNSEQTLLTTRFSHSSVVDHSSLVIPVWKSKLFFSEVDRDIFLYLFIYIPFHTKLLLIRSLYNFL